MVSARDLDLLQRAFRLAERGRGQTSPNPMVGAVVAAADGTILGEGYHHEAGTPHAEVHALAASGGVAAPSVKTIIENIVSLYGILPGDLKEGLPPIEIASTPLPAPVLPPQFVPASARHRGAQDRRKALPVRSGLNQTAAAPATGVRRVAAE